MDKDQEVRFLPFHAINEFMLDEYRNEVVRTVLTSQNQLPGKQSKTLNILIRKLVTIPGFRNSLKAPIGLKIRPLAKAFEKSPELVATMLGAWAEINNELKHMVFDFLYAQDWELLPIEAERSKLPGFLITWPEGNDFDKLYALFNDMFPDNSAAKNDVSLMIVWICGRLPYKLNEIFQDAA